jgi:nitrogen-specific signal transduction histidine kinase
MIGTVHDITDRTRLEQQLRQAQKMEAVGRLAGGVAHDFNNILTTILGYSDMLLGEISSDDPKHSALEGIKKAGSRASSLVSQLLAFSRKQVIQPVVLDLNAIVKDLSKMLRRLIGEDIELITALEPALGYVKVDHGQIDQVIMNLAVNARDAMPEGGQLVIETANVELDEQYARFHDVLLKTGPFVMLSITDTGCGMDRKMKAQIFEPFFTTKEPGRGTGLGLSTVYGIIKQADGFVWVYSEPGHGTTFKIYLPRTGEKELSIIKKDTTSQPVGNETILLVEDNSELKNLMCKMLQKCGYEVLSASSSEEAKDIFMMEDRGPIHLLVTDVVLRGKSGRRLAESLTGMRRELKVLYMSGYTDETISRHGIVEPGINFLQKPFTQEGLARKVRKILDS